MTARYAPVKTLFLYVTEDCNLRCDYCFVKKTPRRMSRETALKTVDFLLNREVSGAAYDLNINLFGGEPFMELDTIEEIVNYANLYRPNTYKKVHFSATTNATIVGPRVERLVRENKMSLLISMDGGPRPMSHRPFVSGRSAFHVIERNLPRLVDWSPRSVVRLTFHPKSLELVENVKFLLELGAPAVAVCPVLEADWRGHEERLDEAYQALADWYIQEARRGILLPLVITHTLLLAWHRGLHGAPRPSRPCSVGTSMLAVDPDGHVMPCHRFISRPQDWLGRVDRPALEGRTRYVEISSRNFLGCDKCTAEPVCGGGCRTVALIAGLGLEEAHPAHCLTMRAHVSALRRIYESLLSEENPAFHRLLKSTAPVTGAMAEMILS